MSTLTADPGFARGQVLGVLWKAYDADNGDGSRLTGSRKTFLDENPTLRSRLSNRTVDCICVKNSSGSALLPGQVAKFSSSASLSEVSGLATSSDTLFGVVDEYLPAAGVANGEIFWLVITGPATVLKTSGAGTGITALGGVQVSATAGSVAAGTSPLVGYCIATAATTDTTVRVQVNTQVR